MSKKFRNKYRIESARLHGYDYTRNGAYFITICTKNHKWLFWEIIDGSVKFDISDNAIVETGLRPVSTTTMGHSNHSNHSNHSTHKIETKHTQIMINSKSVIQLSDYGQIVYNCWFDLPNHYSNIILDEFVVMPDHVHGIIIIQNHSDRKTKHGLSEFVRAFKSFSSRRINELRKSHYPETWQPRFHDHIIRSNNELNRIRKYIRNNPNAWLSL
jgi:putative transposase